MKSGVDDKITPNISLSVSSCGLSGENLRLFQAGSLKKAANLKAITASRMSLSLASPGGIFWSVAPKNGY